MVIIHTTTACTAASGGSGNRPPPSAGLMVPPAPWRARIDGVMRPAPRLRRRAALARAAAAALAALALAACQGASGGPTPSGPVPLRPDILGCGRPGALAPFPGPGPDHGYLGAHIGALWWVTAPGQQRLVVADYSPDYPAKAPIELAARLPARVALHGWSCATGERLRFCYLPGCQHPIPGLGTSRRYSPAELKAMGDQEALLPPGLPPGDSYVGYLLFWQPGLYRVRGYQGGRLLGTVVFGVPATGSG
jgi:hypothetical protein